MKTCYRCKKSKSLEDFYFNKSRLDGLEGRCKVCLKALHKKDAQAKRILESKKCYERTETIEEIRDRRGSKKVFDLGPNWTSSSKDTDDFTVLEIDCYLRELERRKEKIRADKHR